MAESIHQYLSFFANQEEYAVSILEVTEIVGYTSVTRMPSMPSSIRGVTNLRGRVVPVVDLAVRIGLPESAITRRTCIVMVEAQLDGEKGILGLLVDSVSQVMDLPPEQIEPPPSFGSRIRVDYIKGMGRVGTRFVPLLNLHRLLDVEGLLAVGRAVQEPAPSGEATSRAEAGQDKPAISQGTAEPAPGAAA